MTLLIFNFKSLDKLGTGFLILNQYSILNFKTIVDLVLALLLLWGLIVVFFIDLEHQIIPDGILLPVILLYSLYSIFNIQYSIFVVAFLASLFFFFLHFVTRGKGMGFGDVKLAFLMGLVLGYPKIMVAFYLAFLTGGMMGVILILIRKAKFGQRIAFGPFLAGSALVAYLWGEKIIELVQKLLF